MAYARGDGLAVESSFNYFFLDEKVAKNQGGAIAYALLCFVRLATQVG
jgi:hypothetical protein